VGQVVAMDAIPVTKVHLSQTLKLINACLKQALADNAKRKKMRNAINGTGTSLQKLKKVAAVVGLGDPASWGLLLPFVQNQELEMLTIVKTAITNKQTIVFAWQPSSSGIGFHAPRAIDKDAVAIPVMLYSTDLHSTKKRNAAAKGYSGFQTKHKKALRAP
jgi:hypothetical protein